MSLTPLIDVVFILLVFFMLASTFTDWRSLELGVPAEATEPAEDEPDPLVVRVGDDEFTINGDELHLSEVAERVERALADEPERVIIVRPGADVPLQRVVSVMERLHAVGGSRLSLQREE